MDRYFLYIIHNSTAIHKVFPKRIVNFFPTPQKLTFSQQNTEYRRYIYQIP